MASPLQFSLGLATGGFLGPLAGATRGLAAFLGVTVSVSGVVAGVWREISRGGALTDLSHRTGESVRDLLQLQYAFQQSGASADQVAPVLQRFRQSLSGVGESGENTAEAFAAINLSIEQLKNLDAPQALAKVFAGLNAADRNTAAGAAGTLFGRGGAGEILQIARDGSAFADALRESAAQAGQMERLAGVFDHIGDTIVSLKLQLRGAFLGLAEEVAPAINGILTTLANRDFATLGKIVELSLTVAFENAVTFLASALTKLFAALPELAKAGVKGTAAGIGIPLASSVARFIAGSNEQAANQTSDPQLAAEQRRNALGWRLFAAAGEEAAPDLAKQAGASFVKAFKAAMDAKGPDLFGGTNAAALAALLQPFGPSAIAKAAPGIGGVAATNLLAGGGKGAEANALERVGALFGAGAGSSLTDHARQTASNTRESAKAIYKVNATLERMERQTGGGFANV